MIDMESHLVVSEHGARITLRSGSKTVVGTFEHGHRADLIATGTLDEKDVPKGEFYWLKDVRGENHGSREVMEQGTAILWGSFLALAHGKPILFQCKRGTATMVRHLLWRTFGVLVEMVRGSLRRDNPYEPLRFNSEDGSDDHIVQVKAV